MGLPEKIKIGGFIINVEEIENLIVKRNNLGEYSPTTNKISIDKSVTEQQKEETLLHEIMEAINCIYDIDLNHHQISIIATVLHQVLKDNELVIK